MDALIACIAALAAGLINAIAGGGTLVSFPVLLALGLPPVTANVTNTLALCPGYFGGMFAQRKELPGHTKRFALLLPVCIAGGIIGGFLLLHSDERYFQVLVPYLILVASILLAVQTRVKTWLQSRQKRNIPQNSKVGGLFLLFLSAVYGGYFGAGVSVIVLTVLGLIYDDSLVSLNVLKQAISLSVNITASIFFIFSGRVEWMIVFIMGVGSITGGLVGGSMVEKINPDLLRWIVVCTGILISAVYFILIL